MIDKHPIQSGVKNTFCKSLTNSNSTSVHKCSITVFCGHYKLLFFIYISNVSATLVTVYKDAKQLL